MTTRSEPVSIHFFIKNQKEEVIMNTCPNCWGYQEYDEAYRSPEELVEEKRRLLIPDIPAGTGKPR